jgi:hypothetical protein
MSQCRNNASVVGCFVPTDASLPPVGIVIHYVYDTDGALVATVYTDSAGAPIDIAAFQGGGTALAGACPVISVDVEHELLCDDVDANPATPSIAFIRRYERRYNAGTGVLISQTVVDLALDLVTPYVISAAANVSANCASDFEFEEVVLCDATGATVVRRQTQINGVFAVVGYFDPAGAAVVPVQPVGACPNCADEPFRGVVTSWAAVR